MPISEPLPELTDRDRRWLVHIFAALRNGIQDELEYEEIDYHNESILDDPDRFNHLYFYVYNAIGSCMEQTHPEEAARVVAEIQAFDEGQNHD